jgi:hypothetical protein
MKWCDYASRWLKVKNTLKNFEDAEEEEEDGGGDDDDTPIDDFMFESNQIKMEKKILLISHSKI